MIHDISSDFTGSISGGFGDLTVTLTFSSPSRINMLFGGYGLLVIYIMVTNGSSMSLCTYKHDGSNYVFSSKAISNDKSFGVIPSSVSSNKIICKGSGENGSYTYSYGHGFIIRAE